MPPGREAWGSNEAGTPIEQFHGEANADHEDVSDSGLSQQKFSRWMKEGTEAFAQGRYNEASLLFMRVAMGDPANVDGVLAYAVARFATGDYGVSALAIRRGIQRFPEVVNSGFDLRDRYGKMEDFDQHLAALEQFVRENPDNIDGWVVLGLVRHFTGQRELARRTFELVKRQSPEDTELSEVFLNANNLPSTQRQDAAEAGQVSPSTQE